MDGKRPIHNTYIFEFISFIGPMINALIFWGLVSLNVTNVVTSALVF